MIPSVPPHHIKAFPISRPSSGRVWIYRNIILFLEYIFFRTNIDHSAIHGSEIVAPDSFNLLKGNRDHPLEIHDSLRPPTPYKKFSYFQTVVRGRV